jgi:hypothetical protein
VASAAVIYGGYRLATSNPGDDLSGSSGELTGTPVGDGEAIYGTGNSASQPPKARVGVDVQVDDAGNVIPGVGGASAAETPAQVQTRGILYEKKVDANDQDIEYRRDGGLPDGRGGTHPDGHVSAVPRRPQSFDNYNEAHRRGWQPVRDPATGKPIPGPKGK